ncbi:Heat stress transcription factor A-3, partial [Bienertia sinuspersici]
NEMKRLLEQRKAGEISLTDEEIYAKIKPKGKRNCRDRRTGVSPSITSLFGGFSECEKLRKEANKAMNEAAEAKKEAISANEQNKFLTKKLKDVERGNKVTRHYLEKFLNTIGYNLSEFNMDDDFEELKNTRMKKTRMKRKSAKMIKDINNALYFCCFF